MAGKEERVIVDWAIVRENGRGVHFAGRRPDGLIQVSSQIATFDVETLTGTTGTGRPYRLSGPMDSQAGLEAALVLWSRQFDVTGSVLESLLPEELDEIVNPKGYGSGNIFRDLGLPNADVLLAKSELALGICDLIREKGLSVEEAAVIAGMEPAVLLGALERPHRSGLSIERLDRIYEALIEVPGRTP